MVLVVWCNVSRTSIYWISKRYQLDSYLKCTWLWELSTSVYKTSLLSCHQPLLVWLVPVQFSYMIILVKCIFTKFKLIKNPIEIVTHITIEIKTANSCFNRQVVVCAQNKMLCAWDIKVFGGSTVNVCYTNPT